MPNGDARCYATEEVLAKDSGILQAAESLRKILPDPPTVSRALSSIDGMSIARVRELCRNLVIERLKKIAIYRFTLDFDEAVLATLGRTTEGTAGG